MAKDLMLDDNGDLLIENGDLVLGDADNQNVQLIFQAYKGEIRSSPELGFGAGKYVKSTDPKARFKRDLKVELAKDNYKDVDIEIDQSLKELKVTIQ